LDFRHLKALRQHIDIETEVHHCCKDIVHVNLSIAALRNSQGDKTGIVVTMQDISQIKRLEERANRSDRLAAMGEMAGKIAHEVRNPLGSIELFASILRKELEGQGDLKMFAEHISTGTKSINNIISNLLLFIRPQQKPKFHAIDICGPLNDSLFFSNYLIKSTDSIEIMTQFHPKPLVVNGDLELLKQLFLNLILNAVQAMPNGGALTISTKQGKTFSNAIEAVEIRIADTGTGISSLDLPKVFDPFFTTKERGTGLGLAIVHNIVLIHGGTIDIESVEGKGTECVVMLPLHDRARRKQRE
jgi:signal transduction histidine kinase